MLAPFEQAERVTNASLKSLAMLKSCYKGIRFYIRDKEFDMKRSEQAADSGAWRRPA